jgi:uncharacterized protein HemX
MEEQPTPKPPVMDVVPPPVATELPRTGDPKPQPPAQPKAAPEPPKPPKQPGNGVTAAIVATVIIVLGLALLAVYAYLKQK